MKGRFAEQRLDLTLTDAFAYEKVARSLGSRVVLRDVERLVIGVRTDGSARHVRDVLDEVDPARTSIAAFSVHTATLDDVFLALTGHATGAGAGDAGATSDASVTGARKDKEAAHV